MDRGMITDCEKITEGRESRRKGASSLSKMVKGES